MTTCQMSVELGAFVLHALEHDEDEDVRRHVADCDLCRDEVQDLSFTVSLLSLLSLEDLAQLDVEGPATEPPATATEPPGRPHRRALLAGIAAAAAIIAVPGVRMLDRAAAPPPTTVVRATDPTTRVEAAVTLAHQESGTRVRLELSGAYPSGRCALVAHSLDGQTDTAATWRADPSGFARVAGTTAIPTSRLSELDVVTDTGRVLVRIPVDQDS